LLAEGGELLTEVGDLIAESGDFGFQAVKACGIKGVRGSFWSWRVLMAGVACPGSLLGFA
jgi:hypothetical protein